MNEALWELAQEAVEEVERAGGLFKIQDGCVYVEAQDPKARAFRQAFRKARQRKELVDEFLFETRAAGPALRELWQTDPRVAYEWDWGPLEAMVEIWVYELLSSVKAGKPRKQRTTA